MWLGTLYDRERGTRHDEPDHSNTAAHGGTSGEHRRASHAATAADDGETSARTFVRIGCNRRDHVANPLLAHELRQFVRALAKADVEYHDRSRVAAGSQESPLERGEGQGEIGPHRDGGVSRIRVDTARHIKRDDRCGTRAARRDLLDGGSDIAPRGTARSRPQYGIDDDALAPARPIGNQRPREVALRLGILRPGRRNFLDGDMNAGHRQRARQHPTVAAVISGAGDDVHTVTQKMGKPSHDLRGGGGAGALHQRSRRNSRFRGVAIERGSIRGAEDTGCPEGTRVCHVPISAAAYPTTRSWLPLIRPECEYPTTSARSSPARRATSSAQATGTRPHIEMCRARVTSSSPCPSSATMRSSATASLSVQAAAGS